MTTAPLMLYDGSCGLCAASVQFILRHEHRHTLRFAALDSAIGTDIRARHPELAGVDSMVWVEFEGASGLERVSVRSGAVLEAAHYVGGAWQLMVVGRLLPAGLRDAIYRLIARHRHAFFAAPEQCYLPPPDMAPRFLS